MRTKSEQLAMLDSDVTILDTLNANTKGTKVSMPGEWMPDGEPFTVDLKGIDEMTNELRHKMCNEVRSQYHAREDSANNTEAGDSDAPTNAGSQRGTAAGNGRRSAVAAKAAEPEHEESMAQVIEAQITKLSARLVYISDTSLDIETHLAKLAEEKLKVEKEIKLALYVQGELTCITDLPNESQEAS